MRRISYQERADFYEIERTSDEDRLFLQSLITDKVTSILEIPAGAGNNTEWLCRSGRTVVLADKEPAMVKRIRERLKKLNCSSVVSAAIADITDFDLGKRFDLILVPHESFQLISTDSGALNALRHLSRHLADGGTLMIALANFSNCSQMSSSNYPTYYDPTIPDNVTYVEWTRPMSQGETLTRSRIQIHGKGFLTIRFQYRIEGLSRLVKEFFTEVNLRQYTARSFCGLLEKANLTSRKIYRNYKGDGYQLGDSRMIFLLEKADATT